VPTETVWYRSVVTAAAKVRPPNRRYLREPVPIFFPEFEEVGENGLHLRLRTTLFLILEHRLGERAFVGSDQFVYWDPTDPRACLSPDACVRLGGPPGPLGSFKAWEHGAPHLGVEILSPSDARDREHEARLERYRRCGIPEVVVYDPDAATDPLRIWDLVDGDLVERDRAATDWRRCDSLAAFWVLTPDARLGTLLRLADHPNGAGLWPTPEEAACAGRDAALKRIAELEAELGPRG
jgi:Uma2 family endonuclease